jgi:hypothetical protein
LIGGFGICEPQVGPIPQQFLQGQFFAQLLAESHVALPSATQPNQDLIRRAIRLSRAAIHSEQCPMELGSFFGGSQKSFARC